jgi:hypothetical protein
VCYLRLVQKRIFGILLVALAILAPAARAQTAPDSAATSTTYVFGGLGGFIPLRDSYRINYSTSLAGIPLEIFGGVLMPVSKTTLVPLTVRYIRREANFVSSTSIGVLSFEPGVRFFLEHEHHGDIRLFGGVEGLLAQATIQGDYEATADGASPTPARASKSYTNYGLGLDLGATYEIAQTSAVDVIIHIASYFGSPISSGGIGNIGGVSIGAVYRIGF